MARENRPQRRQEENDGLIKKLIGINRVSKTVKGGRNMRFAALVVVGDGNGKVGYGTGKAKEVPEAIEKASTGARYTSRPIDIDILFYDDAVIATERLTVPHPLLEERLFALLPLCEIARSKCHPVTGRTVGEMLENRKNEP